MNYKVTISTKEVLSLLKINELLLHQLEIDGYILKDENGDWFLFDLVQGYIRYIKRIVNDKAKYLNTKHMAELLNITPRRLQQLEETEYINKKGRGKWNIFDTVKGYIAFLQKRDGFKE